jgi:hypothetical protein
LNIFAKSFAFFFKVFYNKSILHNLTNMTGGKLTRKQTLERTSEEVAKLVKK